MMRDAARVLSAIAALEQSARMLMLSYEAAVAAGLLETGTEAEFCIDDLRQVMAERFLLNMRRSDAIRQAATS